MYWQGVIRTPCSARGMECPFCPLPARVGGSGGRGKTALLPGLPTRPFGPFPLPALLPWDGTLGGLGKSSGFCRLALASTMAMNGSSSTGGGFLRCSTRRTTAGAACAFYEDDAPETFSKIIFFSSSVSSPAGFLRTLARSSRSACLLCSASISVFMSRLMLTRCLSSNALR